MENKTKKRHPTGAFPTPGGGWKAVWRDPSGVQKSKTFRRQEDALRYRSKMLTTKDDGTYLDPARGRKTLAEFWPAFLEASPNLRPATVELYGRLANRYLLPKFGSWPLARITPLAVRGWIAEQVEAGTGAAILNASFRLLRRVMNSAIEAEIIGRNPTVGTKTPSPGTQEMRFLSAEQVERLAQAMPEQYRALVYLLSYGGLRIGEAAGLRLEDLDLLRGRVTISRTLSEIAGRLVAGPTKTGARRTVTLPQTLRQILEAHIENHARDGYVFSAPDGGPLRPNNFRKRVFYPAVRDAGVGPLRVHDLRHTCAALLISQGAHAKEIAARLGHSSPLVTMSVYAHILPSLEERLAEGLDATLRGAVRGS